MSRDDQSLYFAYGSNLDVDDWSAFCARIGIDPDVIDPLCCAVLPDMRLCFDYHSQTREGGALNICPARGHVVHGVLFSVTQEGWQALDRKEGAPFCYAPRVRTAILPSGLPCDVVTYEVVEDRRTAFCAPTERYREVVTAGLQAWGLPVQAFDDAANDFPPRAEIDHVFIYGTLLDGQRNAAVIPDELVSASRPASTVGELFDTGYGFPAMTLTESANRAVRGACLQITHLPGLLARLDQLEGFGGYDDADALFKRIIVNVNLPDGEARRAWCYVAANGDLLREPIEHGCWVTHVGMR